MPISCVNDLQGPSTVCFLAPEMHAEERPVVEARAKDIPRSLEQQRRRGTHRRSQQQSQISTREEP